MSSDKEKNKISAFDKIRDDIHWASQRGGNLPSVESILCALGQTVVEGQLLLNKRLLNIEEKLENL